MTQEKLRNNNLGNLALVGAGPVGVAAARAAVEDGAVANVVAVIDPNEDARRHGAALLGGVPCASVEELRPSLAGSSVVAFSSRARSVEPVVERLVQLGCHVVTTCEELADPPAGVRRRVDAIARRNERSIVVAGANPGFLMDRLPLALSTGCRGLRSVKIVRRVDTSTRRATLVTKSGFGLTTREFVAGVRDGTLGHVGLEASARLLAEGLRWSVESVDTSVEPVTDGGERVVGQHQVLKLLAEQGRSIVLDLTMAWKLQEPGDIIDLQGEVGFRTEIPGGYPGDEGTTARVVRALIHLSELEPGFYRPTDLAERM